MALKPSAGYMLAIPNGDPPETAPPTPQHVICTMDANLRFTNLQIFLHKIKELFINLDNH
jgi:hypothetical protein